MTTTDHQVVELLPDLNDPVWTIAHVARCFHVTVDRARDYTSRPSLPGARRLGATTGKLLWPREEVLAWFADPPAVSAADRRRTSAATPPPSRTASGRARTAYTPRRTRPQAGEAA